MVSTVEKKRDNKAHFNPKLKFHHGAIGWGVYAIEPIAVGETLIRLERDNQITIEDVAASVEENINIEQLKKLGLKPDCLDALTWTVLIEQQKGNESKFKDYLAGLPGNYDSGEFRSKRKVVVLYTLSTKLFESGVLFRSGLFCHLLFIT